METTSSPVANATIAQNGLNPETIETIWQMGVASFGCTDNQIVIPKHMALNLSDDNVNDLKTRFSAHFDNTQTIAFVDDAAQNFRICMAHQYPLIGNSPPSAASSSAPSSPSSSAEVASAPPKQLCIPGKKSKVPRPPNAFILYRQKYHPVLKAAQPNLVNNQISVIIGRQWKAESELVKGKFRAMAEKIKAQHALQNPGYQYAPRKPSEKKRRMTARKLGQLRSTGAKAAGKPNFDLEMADVAENNHSNYPDRMVVDNAHSTINDAFDFSETFDAALDLDSERINYPAQIKHHRNKKMSMTFPAGHTTVQHDYNINMADFLHMKHATFHSGLRNGQIYEERDLQSLNEDEFMNSLIDWRGIRADYDIIRNCENPDFDNAADALAFEDELEHSKFQAEMNRILWMLE